MMTSDPDIIVLDSNDGAMEQSCPTPTSADPPKSSTTPCSPLSQNNSIISIETPISATPTPVKRAGTDISNLPISTPKRPKQATPRRSPAEILQDKKEKEERRLERLKLAEEARVRKEAEQKRKEEARLKREEEKQKRDEEKQKREEEKRKREEEKRKRDEEKQKREDEKRKREEEKKAVEDQKKKEKEAKDQKVRSQFMRFFKPAADNSPKAPRRVALVTTTSRFHEMTCQPGMVIAPIRRREPLRDTTALDQALQCGTCDSPHYLAELADRVKNQRLRLAGPKRKPCEPGMHPKLLQFSKDHRPPYWGTWRKKRTAVRPRNPFGKEEVLDYDYDSEADWEEEEPGESLSDSDGEDKEEGEDGDEEEDDGFLVPHGYLSDDERGGSDVEMEVDASAAALLRKVGQGGVIAGPELLARFPVIPLLAACPINPLSFHIAAAAPTKQRAQLLAVPLSNSSTTPSSSSLATSSSPKTSSITLTTAAAASS